MSVFGDFSGDSFPGGRELIWFEIGIEFIIFEKFENIFFDVLGGSSQGSFQKIFPNVNLLFFLAQEITEFLPFSPWIFVWMHRDGMNFCYLMTALSVSVVLPVPLFALLSPNAFPGSAANGHPGDRFPPFLFFSWSLHHRHKSFKGFALWPAPFLKSNPGLERDFVEPLLKVQQWCDSLHCTHHLHYILHYITSHYNYTLPFFWALFLHICSCTLMGNVLPVFPMGPTKGTLESSGLIVCGLVGHNKCGLSGVHLAVAFCPLFPPSFCWSQKHQPHFACGSSEDGARQKLLQSPLCPAKHPMCTPPRSKGAFVEVWTDFRRGTKRQAEEFCHPK